MTDHELLARAVSLAAKHSATGANGPFGAVVAKDGKIIGEGWNRVVEQHDPTAHAEINALREACRSLQTHRLQGCTIYTSCEPCPMCLAALYWAKIDAIFYACTTHEAEAAGFADARIYRELCLDWPYRTLRAKHLQIAEANSAFLQWIKNPDRREY